MSTKPITLILKSEDDTQRFAERLAQADIVGSVWLSGDLGAGKTTLTRYWLRALGHEGAVKSPTYTLVEPYNLDCKGEADRKVQRVYHADLYRLQDPEELSFIGFEEYLEDEQALIIIEWASRGEDYLPEPLMTINIHVTHHDGQEVRQVVIESHYDVGLNADDFQSLQ